MRILYKRHYGWRYNNDCLIRKAVANNDVNQIHVEWITHIQEFK